MATPDGLSATRGAGLGALHGGPVTGRTLAKIIIKIRMQIAPRKNDPNPSANELVVWGGEPAAI
jgi:hypothetical protein